jgi:hypothetical protein
MTQKPEEWVLVPREPTEKMLDGYWHSTGESREMRSRTHARGQRIYADFLAASPSPEASELSNLQKLQSAPLTLPPVPGVSPLKEKGEGSSSTGLPAHGAPQSSAPETEAAHSAGVWQPTHRHVKRGTLYELLGLGMLQIEPGASPLQDYDRLAVYWDEKGGLWLRPADEFFDGRFEEIPTPSLPDSSCNSEGGR